MNDDLEERLRRLRPAALPPDLLRILRSARPSTRTKRGWPWMTAFPGRFRLAGVGLLAAAGLVFVGRFPSRRSDAPRRFPDARRATAAVPSPRENAVASADRGRSAPSDFNGFRSGPLLTYAALGGGPNTRAGGGFHLEMPAGPFRLDCAYTLVGNDSNNYPFGKFNLSVSDSF